MRTTSFSSSYDEKASQQPAAVPVPLRNTTMTPAGRPDYRQSTSPAQGRRGCCHGLSISASLGNSLSSPAHRENIIYTTTLSLHISISSREISHTLSCHLW
jgi:hypothetical protein